MDTDAGHSAGLDRNRIRYWRQGEPIQNFGDFLSEYIAQRALIFPRIKALSYRLLGSAIQPNIIRDDLARTCAPGDKVAFWGCGLRDSESVPSESYEKCIFLGARGALTRDALGLPADTCLGDPAFIMPLLYEAKPGSDLSYTLCVPHFHEPKTDAEIAALTGADEIVRPSIKASLCAVETVIDRIANARFVLAGSLHAAVIACAYDRPFAFWDGGWIDLPFKWHDLATSLNITAVFVRDVASGLHAYETLLAPRLRKPDLGPLLRACPFYVRPSVMVEAVRIAGRGQSEDRQACPSAIASPLPGELDQLASTTGEVIGIFARDLEEHSVRMVELEATCRQLRADAARAGGETGPSWTALEAGHGALERRVGQLEEVQHAAGETLADVAGQLRALRDELSTRTDELRELRRDLDAIRSARLPHHGVALQNGLGRVNGAGELPAIQAFAPDGVAHEAPRERPRAAEPGGPNWVLLVQDRIPMPEKNSHSVRIFEMLKIILGLGYKVFIVSAHSLEQYKWVVADHAELVPFEDALKHLGVEYVFGREAAIAHCKAHGWRYRTAILSYPSIAHEYVPFVRAYCPLARVCFDCGDLHSVRLEREAKVKQDPRIAGEAATFRKLEALLFANTDATIAISEEEEAKIRSAYPDTRTVVISNIHPVKECVPPFHERRGMLFVGHYLHSPNVDAVRFFAQDILPSVRSRIADAEFLVVGSSMTDEVRAAGGDGVRLLGYVPELQPILEGSRVFVAPLRYGAGVKGKVGQSMSMGLPVVTTSIGAEGMQLVDGENALIADDPAAFSDAVVRLYRDPVLWERLSRNGLHHISGLLSVEAATGKLRDLLAARDPAVGARSN